jgi:SAM-dependent methyltransferase
MSDQFIYTSDDVLGMLDRLLEKRDGEWWSGFFADRADTCPFLVEWPDENLVEWSGQGLLSGAGRALELGCGNGRDAVFLAGLGYRVDAVDFSAGAIEAARGRALAAGAAVEFQCCSILEARVIAGGYDLVYDSGCFHHLAPHRRRDYVDLVDRALKPGGRYGLVCFRPEGGSGYTDLEVYRQASLGGGLGYTEDQLRGLWDTGRFTVQVLRQMREQGADGPCFGNDFLWTLLASKWPG